MVAASGTDGPDMMLTCLLNMRGAKLSTSHGPFSFPRLCATCHFSTKLYQQYNLPVKWQYCQGELTHTPTLINPWTPPATSLQPPPAQQPTMWWYNYRITCVLKWEWYLLCLLLFSFFFSFSFLSFSLAFFLLCLQNIQFQAVFWFVLILLYEYIVLILCSFV